jgi:hypothetical protein
VFKQVCHEQRQQLTICGLNAHFQNGIAKQAIRNLLESVCKQLLHVCAQWPQAVHFALWLYALRNAALLHNSLPVLEDGTSRLEFFNSIGKRLFCSVGKLSCYLFCHFCHVLPFLYGAECSCNLNGTIFPIHLYLNGVSLIPFISDFLDDHVTNELYLFLVLNLMY